MRYASALAILGLLVLVPAAQAAVVPGDDITIDWLRTNVGTGTNNGTAIQFYQNGLGVYGGPFWATIYADGSSPHVGTGGTPYTSFVTFCVERTEYFNPGTRYDIKGLTEQSQNSQKYLTGYAAWVYAKTTEVNPRDLANQTFMLYAQQAIWAGMVTKDTSGNLNTPGLAGSGLPMGTPDFGDILVAGGAKVNIDYDTFLGSGWGGLAELHGYKVINVQDARGNPKQDQVISPENSTGAIPEPASLLIWSVAGGVAVAGAAIRRRRTTRWSTGGPAGHP